MLQRFLALLCASATLLACTTPYQPPVFVAGGTDFPGIVGVIEKSPARPVDVVLIHGMCTHDDDWAHDAIDMLVAAIDTNLAPVLKGAARLSAQADEVQVVTRTVRIAGGTVRFSALIWSPLTTPLKKQLDYDSTGEPTDCSVPGICKPRRAKLNGQLKDVLLNDCLADALIYQGLSKTSIRRKMIDAITKVVEDSESAALAEGTRPGPLVLVSESLGSKVAFDAIEEMRASPRTQRQEAAGRSTEERLALVFMGANQLPILGLADQDAAHKATRSLSDAGTADDSLQRLLKRKSEAREETAAPFTTMTLVVFTDPNDLLSYRLQASRYAVPGVNVADVLVSNDSTYFGYLERPDNAHRGYRHNTAVASLIACGRQKGALCK